jgi:hypothetical protein
MTPQTLIDTVGGKTPSAESLAILACLREAVAEALERKRRLGQYSVQWSPEGPRFIGPDAPEELQPPTGA